MSAQLLTTHNKKKGFTLIELMIAISIIAVISAVGITTFSQAQKLGRDTKRKQDLRSLAVALELYYQKFGHYPCVNGSSGTGGWVSSGTTQSNWITNYVTDCATGGSLDNTYISQVPIDPLAQSNNAPQVGNATLGYGYNSASFNLGAGLCAKASGEFFILVAGLENANDPEVRKNKTYYYCDGVTVLPLGPATPNFGDNKFIITSW